MKKLDGLKMVNTIIEADTSTIEKEREYSKACSKIYLACDTVNDIREVLDKYGNWTDKERIDYIRYIFKTYWGE